MTARTSARARASNRTRPKGTNPPDEPPRGSCVPSSLSSLAFGLG